MLGCDADSVISILEHTGAGELVDHTLNLYLLG
jgi:hypothetical protein